MLLLFSLSSSMMGCELNRKPRWRAGSKRCCVSTRAHISALENLVQSSRTLVALPAKPESASRNGFGDSSTIFRAISIPGLVARIDKWCAVLHSFRAHIRIQCAKKGERVHVGPAYRCQDGHLCPDERTEARAEGIETMLATHPWADSADLKVFLMGFDAGEKFGTSLQAFRNPESSCNPISELES